MRNEKKEWCVKIIIKKKRTYTHIHSKTVRRELVLNIGTAKKKNADTRWLCNYFRLCSSLALVRCCVYCAVFGSFQGNFICTQSSRKRKQHLKFNSSGWLLTESRLLQVFDKRMVNFNLSTSNMRKVCDDDAVRCYSFVIYLTSK